MDAIDILGGLLGAGAKRSSGGGTGSSGGGLGGKILGELLKSAAGGRTAAPPAQPSRSGQAPNQRPVEMEREARSLEELLGVATGRGSAQIDRSAPTSYRPAPEPPRYQPQPPVQQTSAPRTIPAGQPSAAVSANDEAVILIRALINAAKADGRIDAQEQQNILAQVPNDPQAISFLKHEFAQPLDVRDFVWSIPLGMEVKVYTMSLAGMQLDTNAEAQYLRELAHGLRLDPDLCNQIHAKYGAQGIF